MQAKEIKEKLQSLIEQASSLDPNLARRLDEINRWVKDIKAGSLTAKPFVLAFLLEVITDSTVWLVIKSLPTEEQQSKFEQMTPAERYWYNYLFPKWLNEADPKFFIWKQKLMAGEFNHADDDIIKSIAKDILSRKGSSFWHRYIADLSMATDLIVSSSQNKPLCIQVTSVSEEFNHYKYQDWKNTLLLWEIERGLFLSYNPATANFLNQLVNVALYNSAYLSGGKYLKFY